MIAQREDTLTKLPEERVSRLRAHFPETIVRYIASLLGEEHLQAIDNTRGLRELDYLLIAETEEIMQDPRQVKKFQDYRKLDEYHYTTTEQPWVEHEENALAVTLHRRPTGHEMLEDFEAHHNGERYRIWYGLRFPDKIERKP